MDSVYIGPQLKAARKLRGIPNTKKLAGTINRPGFGEKVIGQVERNQRAARDYEIAWLADALQMTVDELTREPAPAEDQIRALHAKLDQVLANQKTLGENIIGRLNRLEQALSEKTDAVIPGVQELLEVAAQTARSAERPQTASNGK